MTTLLFSPDRQPERDAHGFTAHPDLDCFTDRAAHYDHAALARCGFALEGRLLRDDDAVLASDYAEGDACACLRWEPTSPGPGWQLVGARLRPGR